MNKVFAGQAWGPQYTSVTPLLWGQLCGEKARSEGLASPTSLAESAEFLVMSETLSQTNRQTEIEEDTQLQPQPLVSQVHTEACE